ncbi:MAG: DUF2807 domain-containing protein [Alistipes sp.]|nr:DUF2807 domain-containing protein [Alistipes sp.]
MKKFLLTISLLLSVIIVSAQNGATTTITTPTSNPIKQWTAGFTVIDVDAPIRLKLIKIEDGAAPYIVYDTKGCYTSKFEAEVEKGVLKVRERTDLKRESITEVEVYFNALSEIIISKASVTIEGTLTSPLLDITLSNGTTFTADIDVLDLMVSVTGKSFVTLSGKALYQSADISTAEYNASALETMSTMVSSSHNATTKVDATQRLQAKTATGGKVYYKSLPEILRREIPVFGGEISLMR